MNLLQLEKIKYMPRSFPKQCGCGKQYSEDDWKGLPFKFIWPGIEEETNRRFGPDLEHRDCHCKSTICVAVTEGV